MEPAILGVLALILTVMLYLDRSRRNEVRDLRQEMNAGFAEHRKETAKLRDDMNAGFAEHRKETAKLRDDMNAGFAEHRKETAKLRDDMNAGFAEHRDDMNAGFAGLRKEIRSSAERTDARIDQLTATVITLAESLGQVKGRSETLIATE